MATQTSRPQRTTLDGRLVSVEPLDPQAHGPALYNAVTAPESDSLWRYMSYGPFSDRSAFDADLAAKGRSQDPLYFAIVEKATRLAAGHAALLRITPQHRCIEVGSIVYAPRLQQTAAATEAMYLMARYVFDDLGYRRYEWKCDARNAASRAAALRLGFTFEGIFRQHMIVKGENRDTAWFAMLDKDWPAVKAAFEEWLEPANFDSLGRQKAALAAIRNARRGAPSTPPASPESLS